MRSARKEIIRIEYVFASSYINSKAMRPSWQSGSNLIYVVETPRRKPHQDNLSKIQKEADNDSKKVTDREILGQDLLHYIFGFCQESQDI